MKQARLEKRTLCIWLPNWPIQRIHTDLPELKRQPLILYEEYRHGCLKVVSCSQQAKQQGIVPGMSLAEATALAAIHVEEYNPIADRKALERLAEWCEQFSPTVGLEDSERPESLLLDTSGVAPLFGGEQVLAERVQWMLSRQGYTVRVAVADTVGAAWAVAHYGSVPAVVPPGKSLLALKDLTIDALRMPASTVQLLAELGVQQIGQLFALPRSGLASRFDRHLLLRLNQAAGDASEVIATHRPPPEIEAESVLEYPTERRDCLEFILARLIEQITVSLRGRQQGAIQLQCELQPESGEPIRLLIGLFRAVAVARHLLDLVLIQLERARLPGPVRVVRLSVVVAAPLQSQQQELFDERQGDKRQLGLFVDRLSSRIGSQSVLRAVSLAEAQPEYAYRYEPLTGIRSRRVREQKNPRLSHRPLRLKSPPLPLEVLSVVPNGPPIQFWLYAQQHQIKKTWGPERIQTGWWHGRYIHRDYYRIETACGTRFWIFRRLPDRKWFMHGAFD